MKESLNREFFNIPHYTEVVEVTFLSAQLILQAHKESGEGLVADTSQQNTDLSRSMLMNLLSKFFSLLSLVLTCIFGTLVELKDSFSQCSLWTMSI